MKVTHSWLKQYVEFDWAPEELAERLTLLGVEVEGVKKQAGEFPGIVVAQVITRDKHPNADKLSLCRVADGQGERQIVCGANNFKAGDKVPLILPGNTLPPRGNQPPLTIKVGKIRGVESHGMLCSPQELGLPDAVDGLLILKPDAHVGQSFAEYLGRPTGDVVYDLEITPNRPDWNSVIGLAREIGAVTGNPQKWPKIPEPPAGTGKTADDLVAVRLEDSELCPRYTARVVRGVRIGPSPDWLRRAVEAIGMRSINNVVDVTNFVMLECGQPLHAFDYRRIAPAAGSGRPTIIVRRANAGEKFTTLDGRERTLDASMLLIADEAKAIALAGVMGGQNSEIQADTTDVLIESAYFQPQSIRATAKRLELRTESSYRFERGGDIGVCDWASRRAAQLILETAGGTVVDGVVDAYPRPVEPRQVPLCHVQTTAVLGVEVPMEQQIEFLHRLGLETAAAAGIAPATGVRMPHTTIFRIPSFRVDLKGEIDLIEEVGRLYGVDRIPSTPPRGALGSNAYDAVHDQIAEARRLLVGLGLCEAQGQTLLSEAAGRLVRDEAPVLLANPMHSEMNALRPALLPGLLAALRQNVNHKTSDVALFEVGRVFVGTDSADTNSPALREERHLAIALTGRRQPTFWSGLEREEKFDLADLKGLLEEFFEQFGVRGITWTRRAKPTTLLAESATVHLGKFELGELGQMRPALAREHDLRDAVCLAELNLDVMLVRRNPARGFKPLAAFPAVRRDVALIVPEATTHDAILQVVRQTKPANLETIELFDIFRGKNIPDGQKSVAYAFTYRHAERSLTDTEVNAANDRLVAEFKAKLTAVIRE